MRSDKKHARTLQEEEEEGYTAHEASIRTITPQSCFCRQMDTQ